MPDNMSRVPETDDYLMAGQMSGGVGGPVGTSATEYALETRAVEPGGPEGYEDAISVQQLTQFELAWRRFRRHPVALVGATMLGVIILMTIFAPFLTHVGPADIHIQPPEKWITDICPIGTLCGSTPPTFQNFPDRIMGVDTVGHSIWSDVLYGGRISLIIGIGAALISITIGTALGSISGYFGGWVDMLLQRFTDMMLSIPFLPLMIAVSAIIIHNPALHQNSTFIATFIILAFGLLTWPGVTRIVRSYYLTFREQEFTEAAKAVGVNDFRIIFRHILPNAIGPIIVLFTLNVAGFITLEATLDFLGLGIVFPPTPTWGNILNAAQGELLIGNWWWATFPGLMLLLTVLAINFMGDGLRDALDVRSKE